MIYTYREWQFLARLDAFSSEIHSAYETQSIVWGSLASFGIHEYRPLIVNKTCYLSSVELVENLENLIVGRETPITERARAQNGALDLPGKVLIWSGAIVARGRD